MPRNTGKTTMNALAKRPKVTSTMAHRDHRRAWLAEDPKYASAYLQAALETGEPGDLMQALRDIAEARGGLARVASDTGLNRETLYRTLSKSGNPQLSNFMNILRATGLRLAVVPA